MSDRPAWLRGDLIAAAVVVVALAFALLSREWRAAGGATASDARNASAAIAPFRAPKLDVPVRPHHASPFNDSLTARAESLCVRMVESQIGFQLKEPVSATVTDRYGVGDQETGAGDSLDFDGLGRTPSGRIRAWHCGMANLGAYPGSPRITHTEGR